VNILAPKAHALIKVEVSKNKMYKAKVDVLDLQRRWDRPGLGESTSAVKYSEKQIMK